VAWPEQLAEPSDGVGANALGPAEEVGTLGVQLPGASATAGSSEGDGLFGAHGTGAKRTAGLGVAGRADERGAAGGARHQSPLCPVDGQPFAMLACLALAGGKRREALGNRRHPVALAVGHDLRANLFFGERRATHVA